jgi:Protein of unknown function (DUF3237)
VSVATEYLATVEAPLEPAQSAGSRVIVNVPPGGTVRGPKINGTLIAPAGDWLTVMPDGSLRLDVRATIKTDDGEIILVTYSGAFVRSMTVGQYHPSGQGQNRPIKADGHYTTVDVLEGGAWKIRLLTAVPNPPPTPPAR